MGYDEIYPRLLDIVHETRLYCLKYSENNFLTSTLSDEGIGCVKRLLNRLHTEMGAEGFDETHIHHDGEYITVHRVHPQTRKGVFLIAHTAFPGYGDGHGVLAPTNLVGTQAKPIGCWKL
jgi:glycogen debranching enzyme